MPPASKSTGKGRGGSTTTTGKDGATTSSRGGGSFRGRGRGLTGFAGLGPSTLRNAAVMGGLTADLILKDIQAQPTYPETYEPPLTAWADDLEYEAFKAERRQVDKLKRSPYYIKAPDATSRPYMTYTKKTDEEMKVLAFTSKEVKARLNPSYFPTQLWEDVYEPKKHKKGKKRAKRRVDVDKKMADIENGDKEDGVPAESLDSGEEDNMTASENDDDNDYEGNYFDNGEEDEGGDDEGDGDGGD